MNRLELVEQKRHGTPSFPLEYYYLDRAHPRYTMNAHWHKECEIVRVLKGRFTVYINNVKYELTEGEAVFVEAGSLMKGFGDGDGCIYECIVFDSSMLKRQKMTDAEKYIFDGTSSKFTFKSLYGREDSEIISLIDSLFRAVRDRGEFFELEAIGLLYRLFFELQRHGYIEKKKDSPGVSKSLRAVSLLLDWIDNNLTEQISLSALAKNTGLSEKYICRIFKLYTSRTVVDYINERRIEKACVEMATKSITEAAFASGFNELSYFCKLFKRYKGRTPSEYRREILK